ncbi:MAG: hypothetical protein ACUZ8A_04495 [Candidatus Bathyanammoxibius sp.]
MSSSSAGGSSSKHPSLRISYEHVKDVLSQQKQTIREYQARALTIMATATAVAGIGIPLGLGAESRGTIFWGLSAGDLLVVPVVVYAIIVFFAYKTYSLRRVWTVNNPVTVREYYWKLSEQEFLRNILVHLERKFKVNQEIMEEKQKFMKPLVALLITETSMVLVWAWGVVRLIPASAPCP